jgi:hypothetical protein
MLCCILSFATLAFGQTAATSLRGVVKDPSGALVPGADVTLLNKANGKTMSATANSAGLYVFAQIPPAKYTITVSAAGFGSQTKTAELLVNQPATIDFALTVESSTFTVDVSATAQTLNTSDATLGDAVGNTTIESLPMEGRDPVSLLTLQPGVLFLGNPQENNTSDTRSGSVSGGRSDQGNITLDGMDDNDQVAGTAFTGVLRATLDSTEEFRVTTSNGTADSGRSSGAQVSIVTKSGTNALHGALYEYYRPTNTVANQWFNKYTQTFLGEANTPQKYVMNTFGGSLGGPIKKDKLFFFFNYEGQRKAIDDVVDQTFPTQNFYKGELGYQDASGATHWMTAPQVTTLDQANNAANQWAPCDPTIGCGPNAAVISYFGALAAKGFYGTAPTVGDGINNAGFIFASPAPSTLNTSIAKVDYNLSATQHLFFRGNLQKDTAAGDENAPGQGPSTMHIDNTKGLALGHTWTPTANLVNDLRYGYIRQGYSTRGAGTGTGDWVSFRFISQPEAQDRSILVDVPVNNIADNLTWSKGNHTVNAGGNWRGIQNNRSSDENSYSGASSDPDWMANSPNAPLDLGSGFQNSYQLAYDTLVGTVPKSTVRYNYRVTGPTSGTLFPDGAMISRHFRANEFEYFVQDSWRVTPALTVTYGVRHSILQTPYEVNGQQVSPTVDTHAWFLKRGAAAAQGQVYEDNLEFAPSGKANHAPGYWAKQKANFAPRLSAAYAANAKTSIRVGAGMYYDHFGQGIVNSFDQEGSFGLSNGTTYPSASYAVQNTPRFSGAHTIPSIPGCPNPSATITYPYTPSTAPGCGFAITWGIDNHLKTPYSYAFDLSVQRELPASFTAEATYVGRLSRHGLQQLDLAEPVNLVDSKGGGDYFTAGKAMSKISDQNGGCNPSNSAQYHCTVPDVAKIPYFEDMFPYMAGTDYAGESATQAVYNDAWSYYRYDFGATTALDVIDFMNPNGPQFFNQQFASLYAWSSIGTSSYNALQISVKRPSSHGLTVDLNYTLSKSLDMGSGAERANEWSTDSYGNGGAIQNSWNPKLNKGVSDFDTKHLVTVDWVYALPVGKGKMVAGTVNPLVNDIIGGWQWSGLSRWASGLPFSVYEPGYTTNYQQQAMGVVTGSVKTARHLVSGIPQVFAGNSASTINNGILSGTPIRLPYPGEAGQRNVFRGDGYFNIDSSLTKTWSLPEAMKLKFAAEVYNVGNNVRFDDSPKNLNGNLSSGTFGAYGGMLTTYRRMQFGLRLDF